MLSLKDLQFQAEGKIQTLKEEGTYRNFSVINRQAGAFQSLSSENRTTNFKMLLCGVVMTIWEWGNTLKF